MREQGPAVKRPYIQGALPDVVSTVSIKSNGRALAAVLKSIEPELGNVNVRISPDMRRATLNLPNKGLATVRVTAAKSSRLGGMPLFRFRTPADLQKYDLLYFGGIAEDGSAIVYKLTPSEIGRLQTISLKGSPHRI